MDHYFIPTDERIDIRLEGHKVEMSGVKMKINVEFLEYNGECELEVDQNITGDQLKNSILKITGGEKKSFIICYDEIEIEADEVLNQIGVVEGDTVTVQAKED